MGAHPTLSGDRTNTVPTGTPGSGPTGGQSQDGLQAGLKNRHLSMIAIGGVIGAGLFVGSGAGIAAAGPAILLSYALVGLLVVLVMRMLGEMAAASPDLRLVLRLRGPGPGPLGRLLHRLAVLVLLVGRARRRGHRGRHDPAPAGSRPSRSGPGR